MADDDAATPEGKPMSVTTTTTAAATSNEMKVDKEESNSNNGKDKDPDSSTSTALVAVATTSPPPSSSKMKNGSNMNNNNTPLSSTAALTVLSLPTPPQNQTASENLLSDAQLYEHIATNLIPPTRSSAKDRLMNFAQRLKVASIKTSRASFLKESEVKIVTVRKEEEELALKVKNNALMSLMEDKKKEKEKKKLEEKKDYETKKKENAATDATATQSSNSTTTTTTEPNNKPTFQIPAPLLKPKDKWVAHHSPTSLIHCPSFSNNIHCPYGAECKDAHVYTPPPSFVESKQSYTREELTEAYKTYRSTPLQNSDFGEKIKPDDLHRPWYTSRFKCPVENIFYYPYGAGKITRPICSYQSSSDLKSNRKENQNQHNVGGQKSSQNIWWYIKMKEARDCVATVVLWSLKERGIVPKEFAVKAEENLAQAATSHATNATMKPTTPVTSSTTKVPPPPPPPKPMPTSTTATVTPFNWMELSYINRCTNFHSKTNPCIYAKTCQYAHVHYPTYILSKAPHPSALSYAYTKNFHVHFHEPSNLYLRQSNYDYINKCVWYTASIKCPVEHTIYYAAGGVGGIVNGQNIFLYQKVEDAKRAVMGVVLNAFTDRGLFGSYDDPNPPPPPPPPPVVVASRSTMVLSAPNIQAQQQQQQQQTQVQQYQQTVSSRSVGAVAPVATATTAATAAVSTSQQKQQQQDQNEIEIKEEEDDDDEEEMEEPKKETNTAPSSSQQVVQEKKAQDHTTTQVTSSSSASTTTGVKRAAAASDSVTNTNGASSSYKKPRLDNKSPTTTSTTAAAIATPKPTAAQSLAPVVPAETTLSPSPSQKKKDTVVDPSFASPIISKQEWSSLKSAHEVYTPKATSSHYDDNNKNRSSTTPSSTTSSLQEIYKTYRNDTPLSSSDFRNLVDIDHEGVSWYSACLFCPLDKTVYVASSSPSFEQQRKCRDGITWYKSLKEAREALKDVVIMALKERGIIQVSSVLHNNGNAKAASSGEKNGDGDGDGDNNKHNGGTTMTKDTSSTTTPEVIDPLPTLRNRDYMVSTNTVQCRLYNTPKGCAYGPKCKSAHVHYPSNPKALEQCNDVPDEHALRNAYRTHFQIDVGSNEHFCTIMMLDGIDKRKQWHTAAWLCPKENVIYYACGGRNGKASLQGLYWYPTERDAKLAVSAVVLRSFEDRGLLVGDWRRKM